MDFIDIELIKWAKYNPRKDIKNPSWFALSNRLLEDPSFCEFTAEEFKAWIYVLCQASQKNSPTVRLFFGHASKVCGVSKRSLSSALDKLEILESIQYAVRDPNVSVRERVPTLHNTTLQDTTEHNKTEHYITGAVVRERPPDPTQIHSVEDLIKIIPEEIRGGWPRLYPDPEYVPRELIKAVAWCQTNSKKTPKSIRGWSTFFNGWLERGWERHRKSMPTTAAEGQVRFRSMTEILADEEKKAGAQ